MLPALAYACAGFAAAWKSLGKWLLHPLVKKWLSRDPSLGFWDVLSLRQTYLEVAALEAINKSLRTCSPLRVVSAYIDRLEATPGLVTGLRLHASGVVMEMECVGESDWEGAAEDVAEAARNASSVEAAKSILLVRKHLDPQAPFSKTVSLIIERLLMGAKLDLTDLRVRVLPPRGKANVVRAQPPPLEIALGALVKFHNCWSIERGGTRIYAQFNLGMRVGEQDVMHPCGMNWELELPCILRTLLTPVPSPAKRANVTGQLQHLQLEVEPFTLTSLMEIMQEFGAFAEWKAGVEEEARLLVAPLHAEELDSYRQAIKDGKEGKDLENYEQRLHAQTIVNIHSEAEEWPVPEEQSLHDWLELLAEEQSILRKAEVQMESRGFSVHLRGEDAFREHGVVLRIGRLILGCDYQDSGVATRRHPLDASIAAGEIEVLCDPKASMTLPVLAACEIKVEVSHNSEDDESDDEGNVETWFFKVRASATEAAAKHAASNLSPGGPKGMQGALITATASSRAIWKISRVLEDLSEALSSAAATGEATDKARRTAATAERKKQEAQLSRVKKLFEALDTDSSGFLELDEVRELLASIYSNFMTPAELTNASKLLFDALVKEGDEGLSFSQVERLLSTSTSHATGKESVCLTLQEFQRPVSKDFGALQSFDKLTGCSEYSSLTTPPSVLQLHWVRTLQNYKVAEQTWKDSIAPKLKSNYRHWQLLPTAFAVDFWSDPTFSLSKLGEEPEPEHRTTIKLDLKVRNGLCARLGDSQHISAAPRVQVQLLDVTANGGLQLNSLKMCPTFKHLSAEAELRAWYLNDESHRNEPLVEPWQLRFNGNAGSIKLHAYRHLVVNITPPLLHAMSMSLASLRAHDSESSKQEGARAPIPSEGDLDSDSGSGRVIVWIVNHTGSDIRVTAKDPSGKSMDLRLAKNESQPTPIRSEGKTGASKAAFKRIWSRVDLEKEVEDKSASWLLSVSGCDEKRNRWVLEKDVNFSVTGDHVMSAGRWLVRASVSVDVQQRAPIVTLSGVTTVKNLTPMTLLLDGSSLDSRLECKPGVSMRGRVGGNFEIQCQQPDSVSGGLDLDEGHDGNAGENRNVLCTVPKDQDSMRGSVKVLMQKENVRCIWNLINDNRDLLCVPRVQLFNGLPCVCRCRVGPVPSDEAQGSRQEGKAESVDCSRGLWESLEPGSTSALQGADADAEIEILIEVSGCTYHLEVPAGVFATKASLWRFHMQRKRGRARFFHLKSDDDKAPHLDLDFHIEDFSAVIVVYARYWVTNKTGWELQVSSGSRFPGRNGIVQDYECISPSPLSGSVARQAAESFASELQQQEPRRRRSRRGTSSSSGGSVEDGGSGGGGGGEGGGGDAAGEGEGGEIEEDRGPGGRGGGQSSPLPELALVRADSEALQFKLVGRPTGWSWAWDQKRARGGQLTHWTHAAAGSGWETDWSPAVSVAMVGATGIAELPSLVAKDNQSKPAKKPHWNKSKKNPQQERQNAKEQKSQKVRGEEQNKEQTGLPPEAPPEPWASQAGMASEGGTVWHSLPADSASEDKWHSIEAGGYPAASPSPSPASESCRQRADPTTTIDQGAATLPAVGEAGEDGEGEEEKEGQVKKKDDKEGKNGVCEEKSTDNAGDEDIGACEEENDGSSPTSNAFGAAVKSMQDLTTSTTEGVVVGVAVEPLLAPFQRTKLVTVVPRYVLRNDLDEAVTIWPGISNTRLPPEGEAPAGLPRVDPGVALAIDAVPSEGLLNMIKARRPATAMASIRLAGPASSKDSEEAAAADDLLGPWSIQIPLSAVGETSLTLGAGTLHSPYRVVRASVEMVGATLFIVLVKGRWPYCLENRSLSRSVVLRFPGDDPQNEWHLKPCERRYFVFPNPDAPKFLHARILGSGKSYTKRIQYQDAGSRHSQALLVPGERRPVLKVRLKDRGSTRVLQLQDPPSLHRSVAVAPAIHDQNDRPAAEETEKAADDEIEDYEYDDQEQWLALDVHLAGLHVSLIDTTPKIPVELVALTLDYLQLTVNPQDRQISLALHSLQMDDFGQEDGFVLGPSESGLNSQRNVSSDEDGFRAPPIAEIHISGPLNVQTPVFDSERNVVTLRQVDFSVRALEALLDVPRLVGHAFRLREWASALSQPPNRDLAKLALATSLRPGFDTPRRGGELTCYIESLEGMPVSISSDIRLKTRKSAGSGSGGENETEDDLESRLNELAAGLWLPLRSLVNFLARMGSSFAEAAPTFKFSALQLSHLTGNAAVLQSSVGRHYQQQLLVQSARVLGSLQVLGDPASFLDDVSTGVTSFVKQTTEEVTGQRRGLGSGVEALASGVLGGALASVGKVSSSFKDTVGSLVGQPMLDHSRPKDIHEGVSYALGSLADGLTEAVSGLVDSPAQEQHEGKSVVRFLKDTALGAAGLVIRPIEGTFSAVEKLAEGAEGQVRGLRSGYNGLRRPPRAGLLGGKSGGLRSLPAPLFWPEWNLRLVSVTLPKLWSSIPISHLGITLPGARELWSEADTRELAVVRREEQDRWSLEAKARAWGRVGALRGPLKLQVWAYIDGNLELSKPLRILVGEGPMSSHILVEHLSCSESTQPLEFKVLATDIPTLSSGALRSFEEGENLGKVVVLLSPGGGATILPERYLTDSIRHGRRKSQASPDSSAVRSLISSEPPRPSEDGGQQHRDSILQQGSPPSLDALSPIRPSDLG